MSTPRKERSKLAETFQTVLPGWTERIETNLATPESLRAFDRFFYAAFGECDLPVMIYDVQGQRLVHPVNAPASSPFPKQLKFLATRPGSSAFLVSDSGLIYAYDRLDRWPSAPEEVAFVAVLLDKGQFAEATGIDLTPSEFELVCLLLSGHDLSSAADFVGARYDTKRKQIRVILEKAGLNGQSALLRELALALSAYALNDILRSDQGRPEVDLAQKVYGRDVVVHSISLAESQDIPVWEFGARRGQPILYFHSMLAPIMFTPDMATELEKRNLRILMIPRHFFRSKTGRGTAQQQILQAAAAIVGYFCDEPVICLGESAGCAWAAQFSMRYADLVSEVVLAATPQAVRPEIATKALSRTTSLLTEISTRFRQDERVIAGLTRIYNSVARVPSLARKSLDFMLRQSPADLASIELAYTSLALPDWVRLIANKAARASIDEVEHLQSDWVNDLHRLTRPTRFFHGTDDPLCPVEEARAMAKNLPDTRFHAIEGAGHLILGQRLDEILGALFATAPEDADTPAQTND